MQSYHIKIRLIWWYLCSYGCCEGVFDYTDVIPTGIGIYICFGNGHFKYGFVWKNSSTMEGQGTYMLFLDCTKWCQATGKTIDELLKAGWDVGVAWQDGRMFHGANAIRMNLALPLSRVKEAFERLDKYVFNVK